MSDFGGITSTLDKGVDIPILKIGGATYSNSGNSVIDSSASQHFSNTFSIDGAVTLGATLDVAGDAAIVGALDVAGGFTCDTDKFTVANTSGNTAIAGTLTVTGATALNGGLTMDSNKFVVADTTGNTTVGGTLTVTGATALNGGIACDTDKFTVADTTGNARSARRADGRRRDAETS